MTRLRGGRRIIVGVMFGVLAFPLGAVVGNHVLGAPTPAEAEGPAASTAHRSSPSTADQPQKVEGDNGLRRMTASDAQLQESVEGYRPPAEWAACEAPVPEGHVRMGSAFDASLPGCDAERFSDAGMNVVGTAPPPATLLADCRDDASADPLCGLVLAAADGKLVPGRYTDAELEAAVAAAGYVWRGAR